MGQQQVKQVHDEVIRHHPAVFIVGVPITLVLYIVSRSNYLVFHGVAELFSIGVALAVAMLAWNGRRYHEHGGIVLLGIALAFVGTLDLLHTLTYQGMNVMLAGEANMTTQLWIGARSLQAGAFLAVPFFLTRPIRPNLTVLVFTALTALIVASIFAWGVFPTTYEEGLGLTPFKLVAEYVISFALGVAALLLWRRRDALDHTVLFWLMTAIVATIASELAFTFYVDLYGFPNFIGHILKIAAFYFVYKAIIETSFTRPTALMLRSMQNMQDDLRERENLFRALVERTGVRIATLNRKGEYLFLNDFAARQLGGSPADFVGKHLRDVYPPENVSQQMAAIERVVRTGVGYEHDFTFTFADGPHHFQTRVDPMTPITGQSDAVLVISIDITERIQAEAALRASEERFRLVVESMDDIIFTLDKDLRHTGVYGDWVARSGLTPADFLGKTSEEILGPDAGAIHTPPAREALTGERVVYEWVLPAPEGTQYFQTSLSPIYGEDGETVQGLVGVGRDITERVRAENEIRRHRDHLEELVRARTAHLTEANRQLEALTRVKDEFVSNVSHELRSPITSLKLRVHMIKKKPGEVATYLPTLQREVDRLDHIIESLLHISRLDQARIELDTDVVDMEELIHDYVADRQPLAKAEGITLHQRMNGSAPPAIADKKLVGQVLSILLTNAINYTPAGGVVHIATYHDPNSAYVGFTVKDTGPGIAPDEQGKLFERFYRGQAARDSGVRGTGLGLAIAHEIVTLHGGHIDISSAGIPGQGATFTVCFPVTNTP